MGPPVYRPQMTGARPFEALPQGAQIQRKIQAGSGQTVVKQSGPPASTNKMALEANQPPPGSSPHGFDSSHQRAIQPFAIQKNSIQRFKQSSVIQRIPPRTTMAQILPSAQAAIGGLPNVAGFVPAANRSNVSFFNYEELKRDISNRIAHRDQNDGFSTVRLVNCQGCYKEIPLALCEVEHILPYARFRHWANTERQAHLFFNDLTNLTLLCHKCNTSKNDKNYFSWMTNPDRPGATGAESWFFYHDMYKDDLDAEGITIPNIRTNFMPGTPVGIPADTTTVALTTTPAFDLTDYINQQWTTDLANIQARHQEHENNLRAASDATKPYKHPVNRPIGGVGVKPPGGYTDEPEFLYWQR
jgi:hypothetical protein